MNETFNARNNKFKIGSIICDLEKALDCVNHSRLLPKLELYGITGPTYTLLKSYLQDRHQRVLMNSKKNNRKTPLNQTNWDGEPSGYAENPDNCIC